MTATQITRARNALAWIRRLRVGGEEPTAEHTEAALQVLADVFGDRAGAAAADGRDPDPRVGCDGRWATAEEAWLGLDERERHAAVRHAHRMRAAAAAVLAEAPWLEPALWGVARDRGIVEECERRAGLEAASGQV